MYQLKHDNYYNSMSVEITVEDLNLVAGWEIYDQVSSDCQLCRRSFQAPSLQELQSEKCKVTGKLVKGACGHIFHENCMNDLINSGCQLCPIDKTPWKMETIFKSGAVYAEQAKLTLKQLQK